MNVNWKIKWHLRKKTRSSNFLNDKQLYSQNNGHNLKKKVHCSPILSSRRKSLVQKFVLIGNRKTSEEEENICWINYSFYVIQKAHNAYKSFFSVSSSMMCRVTFIARSSDKSAISPSIFNTCRCLSRLAVRITRPFKPRNCKPSISSAFPHIEIKKRS